MTVKMNPIFKGKVNSADIVAADTGYGYGIRWSKTIMMQYFKCVRKQLMDGYSFDLPGGLGRCYICKNKYAERRLRSASKNKISVYPHRVGYYSIAFESKFLEEYGVSFVPSRIFIQELRNILKHTGKDYRSQ